MRLRIAAAVPALLLALALGGCSAFTPATLGDPGGFRLWYPGAASVQVIGDWNAWGGLESAGGTLDPSCGVMTPDDDGFWTAEAALEKGRYRYAFLVDGHIWVPDPSNHLRAEYGGREVSVLVR
ncbi:MAG: hypothetical protein QUS11_01345 [Candidatus Fermentibacter sp.]|nr:hypothetical protein [Candidatus Fermentibacter sp.]